MNLTPEQLNQILAQSSSGWSPGGMSFDDGRTYKTDAFQGTGEDAVGARTASKIYGHDTGAIYNAGDPFQVYGLDGKYSNNEATRPNKAGDLALMALISALTMGIGGAAMAGGAAGGAGGAGAGAAAGGAGAGVGAGGMVNGAFLGEGVLSGIGAWDGAMAAASAGSAAGAGSSLYNGLNGSDIMSDAFVSNGGYGSGGFGGTNGSYMSNLMNGTGNLSDRVMGGTGAGGGGGGAGGTGTTDLVKAGGSLLSSGGGGGGGFGGGGDQTTQNKMDPRMDPYIYGNGGLLQNTQALMNKQMAPGFLQGYDDMRTQGQGLLNTPMRGNGFNLFTGR